AKGALQELGAGLTA
nr:Chain F, unidentified peptide [Mus musculus]